MCTAHCSCSVSRSMHSLHGKWQHNRLHPPACTTLPQNESVPQGEFLHSTELQDVPTTALLPLVLLTLTLQACALHCFPLVVGTTRCRWCPTKSRAASAGALFASRSFGAVISDSITWQLWIAEHSAQTGCQQCNGNTQCAAECGKCSWQW
jgi:hypothetical protein